MFVDKVTVVVNAGNGGDGAVSFRHEKFVDRGGPDGGDGGKGGNVWFEADENVNTLVNFRYKQVLGAKNGQPGMKRRKHGKNGNDLTVKVPVGTVVSQDGEQLADLAEPGKKLIIAHGGDGGFGNAHFKSSTRQAPRVAELGEKGEHKELVLELKLLADVGLVGFPNAGKSTFLSVISNAKPEIADYPFTTLTPNLGVADIDDTSLLVADIPGLIEGAAEGKGLGDDFLRHIERTAVILHLVDAYEADVAKAYKTITNELKSYSRELANKPRIVVLTKIEGVGTASLKKQLEKLKRTVPKYTSVTAISSTSGAGVKELLRTCVKLVSITRRKTAQKLEADQQENQSSVPVIELSKQMQNDGWLVRLEEGRFIITGPKIERFARRTNFDNRDGLARLRDILQRLGIQHELLRKGAKAGDLIVIGESGEHQLTFQ